MEPDGPLAGVIGVIEMPNSRQQSSGPEELYAASYFRLVGVLAVAAGSVEEAEDVVQDAFVRLIPRWSTVCRYDDPEAWVRKVAFRLLHNRLRRARNRIVAMARMGAAPSPAVTSTEAVDVTAALAVLPPLQRQAVVMHYLLGLPIDDMARTLDVPSGTIKSRLARARVALAPLLREEIHDHA